MLRSRCWLSRSAIAVRWRCVASACNSVLRCCSSAVRSTTAASMRRARPVIVSNSAPSIAALARLTNASGQARPTPLGPALALAVTRSAHWRAANGSVAVCRRDAGASARSQPSAPASTRAPGSASLSIRQIASVGGWRARSACTSCSGRSVAKTAPRALRARCSAVCGSPRYRPRYTTTPRPP